MAATVATYQAAHPIRIRSTVQVYMSPQTSRPRDDVNGIKPLLFFLNYLTSKVQEKYSKQSTNVETGSIASS